MKSINKIRLLIYVVVALAIMNITTLATIGYHVRQSDKEQTASSTGQIEGDAQAYSDRYFRDRLEFSAQQMTSFKEFSTVFREQARSINRDLIEYRRQMLEEMEQEEPDLALLDNLSDSIGQLHASLKHHTYQFYLDTKEISSGAQAQELNRIFQEFFINDNRMGSQGAGPQQGQGPRFQRQSGNQQNN